MFNQLKKITITTSCFIAYGFGSGLVPKAPGTMGTLAAAIIWWFILSHLSFMQYMIIIVIASLLGIKICSIVTKKLKIHDHQSIVWDEFCGFWITMICVPRQWMWLLIGFILFRFYDIIKPQPISWLDKNIKGGLGIMLDDWIAAIYACLSLTIIRYLVNLLFM